MDGWMDGWMDGISTNSANDRDADEIKEELHEVDLSSSLHGIHRAQDHSLARRHLLISLEQQVRQWSTEYDS